MDLNEITDDMIRNDFGDKEINAKLEELRQLYKSKGLPYIELMRSKLYNGSVKYLLKEHKGHFFISDLDTNEEVLI